MSSFATRGGQGEEPSPSPPASPPGVPECPWPAVERTDGRRPGGPASAEAGVDSRIVADHRSVAVPVLLFALTVLSTTYVGGLWFSLPLCAILVCHEMGHYLMARRHGVPVSLPYFIPMPLPPIGTMGAIIGLRAEVRDRDALFDVAAGGPIAGLLLAIPVLCLGIARSPVGPVEAGDMIEGQSLLYLGIKLLLKGHVLPGPIDATGRLFDVKLHPLAFAGWVGLFITLINLLPIGQLDGGRLAAAFYGKNHERRSQVLHRGLFLIAGATAAWVAWQARHGQHPASVRGAILQGASAGMSWVVWAGALLVMKRLSGGVWHPEVDARPLSPGRRWLCRALLVVGVLIFMPWFWREAP